MFSLCPVTISNFSHDNYVLCSSSFLRWFLQEVASASARAEQMARAEASVSYASTADAAEMDAMWQARRDGYFAAFTLWQEAQDKANKLRAERGLPALAGAGDKPKLAMFTTDVCVPLPDLTAVRSITDSK